MTLLVEDFVRFNPLGRSCGTVMIWFTTEVLMCRKQLGTMLYILNSHRKSQVNYFDARRLGQWVQTVSIIVPALIVFKIWSIGASPAAYPSLKKKCHVFFCFQIPLSLMFIFGGFPKKMVVRTPFHTPKSSFFVGKPMVFVGENPPF